MTDLSGPRDVPRWLYLGFPPLMLIVQVFARLVDTRQVFYARWIESELGLIENMGALLLIVAMVLAGRVSATFDRPAERFARVWFALVAVFCLLFFGEEISWGQHWFGWASPEFFQQYNANQETNIHNLNEGLERLLKTSVTISIVIGGILVPLWIRYRGDPGRLFRGRAEWIWPTLVCLPPAAWVIMVRFIERMRVWMHVDNEPFWDMNLKETVEYYIALFFFFYALSAFLRVRALPQARSGR